MSKVHLLNVYVTTPPSVHVHAHSPSSRLSRLVGSVRTVHSKPVKSDVIGWIPAISRKRPSRTPLSKHCHIGALREVLPFCCLVTERLQVLQMGGWSRWPSTKSVFQATTPTSFTLPPCLVSSQEFAVQNISCSQGPAR